MVKGIRDRDVVTLVTFAIFSVQGYAHYLVAKNEGKEDFKFYIPKLNTTIKNVAILGTFSILNGILVEKIKNIL